MVIYSFIGVMNVQAIIPEAVRFLLECEQANQLSI